MGIEELALCIARKKIPASWQADSIALAITIDDLNIWDDNNHQFQRRGDIETDCSLKQIIPYVLVFNEDNEILIYQRHGTEKRLHRLWSLGIGGHVNIEDKQNDRFADILVAGMKRECKEELGVDIDQFSLLGIINEEQTDVGHTHIGIVFTTTVSADLDISEELKKWMFVKIEQLSDFKFELWSLLAMRLIPKKVLQK